MRAGHGIGRDRSGFAPERSRRRLRRPGIMAASTLPTLKPTDVHATLARHILADGFDLVFDFEKSHGSWVFDSRGGQRVPGLPHLLRVLPRRLQPSGDAGARVPARLLRVAQLKPALSDIYTRRVRPVRGAAGAPGDPVAHAARLLHRGWRPRHRERAQDGLRLEGPQEQGEGDARGAGDAGHPLPRGLPRPHRLYPLADQHRPRQDRLLPEVPLAAGSTTRSCASH